MNKISFFIIGCCMSRDPFDITNNDRFSVSKFISQRSFHLLHSKNPPVNIIQLFKEFPWETKWNKDCFLFETTADFEDTVKSYIANYCVIDSYNFAFDLLEISSDTERYHLTMTKNFFDCKDYITNACKEAQYESRIIFSETISEDSIENTVQNFCETILKYYSPSQIILNVFEMAELYTDSKNLIEFHNTDKISKVNTIMEKANRCLLKHLKNAYVVPFPKYIVGDKNHRWGQYNLHVVEEYYAYVYNCLSLITEHLGESVDFSELKETCENTCRTKYFKGGLI